MRKISIAVIALFATTHIYAAESPTTDLNAAINKSIKQPSLNTPSSTIFYGGKDLSRSIVATADENNWTKQLFLVG